MIIRFIAISAAESINNGNCCMIWQGWVRHSEFSPESQIGPRDADHAPRLLTRRTATACTDLRGESREELLSFFASEDYYCNYGVKSHLHAALGTDGSGRGRHRSGGRSANGRNSFPPILYRDSVPAADAVDADSPHPLIAAHPEAARAWS